MQQLPARVPWHGGNEVDSGRTLEPGQRLAGIPSGVSAALVTFRIGPVTGEHTAPDLDLTFPEPYRPPVQHLDEGEHRWSGPNAGPVFGSPWFVPDIARLAHHPPPARKFQQDAIRVPEVERADEHAGMQYKQLVFIKADHYLQEPAGARADAPA